MREWGLDFDFDAAIVLKADRGINDVLYAQAVGEDGEIIRPTEPLESVDITTDLLDSEQGGEPPRYYRIESRAIFAEDLDALVDELTELLRTGNARGDSCHGNG